MGRPRPPVGPCVVSTNRSLGGAGWVGNCCLDKIREEKNMSRRDRKDKAWKCIWPHGVSPAQCRLYRPCQPETPPLRATPRAFGHMCPRTSRQAPGTRGPVCLTSFGLPHGTA